MKIKEKKNSIALFVMFTLVSGLNGLDLGKVTSGGFSDVGAQISKSGINIGGILEGGLGYSSPDLAGLTGFLNVKCDISTTIEIPDVCADLGFGFDGIDLGFDFSRNFNIGGCEVNMGASAGPVGLPAVAGNLCDLSIEPAQMAWDEEKVVQARFMDSYDLRKNAEAEEVVGEDGKKSSMINPTYKNGLKMSDVFKSDGAIGHNTIEKGENIPNDLRRSFAQDDVLAYKSFERIAKLRKPSGSDSKKTVSFEREAYAPPTYLDYIKKRQARYAVLIASKPTTGTIRKKIGEEIKRLKQELGVNSLSGSSSREMKQDYERKYEKLLDTLLDPNIEKDGGNDIESVSEYAKAIRDIENYEYAFFQEREDAYERDNQTIIQPSMKKVNLQPLAKREMYAERIHIQREEESRRRAEFYFELEKKKEEIYNLVKRIFYEEMEYNPLIAQKELEELLSKGN